MARKKSEGKGMNAEQIQLVEGVINWVLPGLQFFYRDTNAPIVAEELYHVGDVLRAGCFLDASTKLLRPAHKTRYIIASAHAVRWAEVEGAADDAKRWGLCTFHYDSYFKVMDIYRKEEVTQVMLLHIPMSAARFMGEGKLLLNFVNNAIGNLSLVDMARQSLDTKMEAEVHPRSLDKTLMGRMAKPVGFDEQLNRIPLPPYGEPDDGEWARFSSIVHRLAEDADPFHRLEGE